MPDFCNAGIRKAHDLCLLQNAQVIDILFQFPLHLDNAQITFEEILRDHCDLMNLFNGNASAKQFKDGEDTVIPEIADVIHQFVVCIVVKLIQMEVDGSDLQRTDGFQHALFQIGTDSHDFAGGLHLCAQDIGCRRKFIKREARELGNNVIQAWLDRCSSACDRDIFQRHAQRDLCRDTRDRIAGCLGCQCGRS